MNLKLIKMRKRIKRVLDEDRYEHTLGVMYTAANMAMYHCADIEAALFAGLLHDCAKCIDNDKKFELCEKYHIEINESEAANPSLLHAKLGAVLARKRYKVTNEDILNAIASHTTGRPEMSLLEKILYIADYMEPMRKELPNMQKVRKLAYQDIDECLYLILKDSLVYLKSKDLAIDPMTEQTYLYYKKALGKED